MSDDPKRRTLPRCTVYRVENECGVGPYKESVKLRGTRINDAHANDAHPGPYSDGIGWDFPETYVCGLPSLPALRTWFAGWGAALDHRGFRVVAYRVPKHRVLHGRVQVMFDRGGCKPLWSKSPSEARVW